MISNPLFSNEWFRVAELTPWLASDVVSYRHVYRGTACYVLQSRSTGKHCRIDLTSYEMIQGFDGKRSVDTVWHEVLGRLQDDAPTQDEFLLLLADLHAHDLIALGRRLETETVFGKNEQSQRVKRKTRYTNPLYLRFRLLNPDPLLTRVTPGFSWIFTRTFAGLWLLLVLGSLISLAPDLSLLSNSVNRAQLTTPGTFLIAFLLWPVLKGLHELAHGIALKHFGGATQDFGIAVMVLFPIPYLDASASAVFANKWHRIIVSVAGIVMDITLCVLAIMIWASSNGMVNDIALVVVLMTGLSTLFFNANPLLKFDGYYVLADYLEIPELAERSSNYVKGVLGQSFFNLPADLTPVDKREAYWLCIYGVFAALYRFALTLLIAWMFSARLLLLGLLLASYAVVVSLVLPVLRSSLSLWRNHKVSRVRFTAVFAIAPLSVLLFLMAVPISSVRVVQGVVWLPDDSIVRVDSLCEVKQVSVVNGATVKAGDILFLCENARIDQQAEILQAERDQLEAEQSGLLRSNVAKYQQLDQELDANGRRLLDTMNRRRAQYVQAQSDGQFVVEGEYELAGRILAAGELAAYVVPAEQARTVRVALPERSSNSKLDWPEILVRAPNEFGEYSTHVSTVTHVPSAASLDVASPALTILGGGKLKASVVDAKLQLDEPAFDVEIAWPETNNLLPIGSRVLVKLKNEAEPIGSRWLRTWQRAFLGRVRA